MKERRKAERLKEDNEVTITVISDEKKLTKEKILCSFSEDISIYGTKIKSDIFLPVDTLIMMDFALKTLKKQMTAIGKVKWIKVIIEDTYYEAGVELVNTPSEAIQKIQDYIFWKQKNTNPGNKIL
ncbi:MAG: PilZ domain-containing protein [Syntrophaceae bacterium]|nr:PilZ domain-containing protein [Syntrophaceae bacterium]